MTVPKLGSPRDPSLVHTDLVFYDLHDQPCGRAVVTGTNWETVRENAARICRSHPDARRGVLTTKTGAEEIEG